MAAALVVAEGRIMGAVGREGSDEAYVLDLCDEVLGEQGSRQHRFDWLLGDPGRSGRRVKLPVDGYWERSRVVVEYRERQHDEPTAFFDKPDLLTVSGVHRGEQRALYDRRRDTLIPARGLALVVIRPADLAATPAGRLHRRRSEDLAAVGRILRGFGFASQPAAALDPVVWHCGGAAYAMVPVREDDGWCFQLCASDAAQPPAEADQAATVSAGERLSVVRLRDDDLVRGPTLSVEGATAAGLPFDVARRFLHEVAGLLEMLGLWPGGGPAEAE